ncbi:GntR family transcriptional regulator [Minwuia thermotolerans]|uniref:GntR family transcriptional regulator n=1 Tax=Minwuia thermotolerans TaxID=2056226 RepID=UPI000D6DC45C|nr:GntR family transcriptional regulator [Minwuia thermotolerans]
MSQAAPGTMNRAEISPPLTVTEWVTDRLREDISRGVLRPGQALWQESLAETYRTSRGPIRTALRELAAEGLVALRSHRSAVVTELSGEDIQELYAMIISLEMVAVRRGVALLTRDDLEHMAALLETLTRTKHDPLEWYETHCAFHNTMVEASGWQRLVKTVHMCRKNVFRYVRISDFFRAGVDFWNDIDDRLMAACRERDVERAVAVVEEMGRWTSNAVTAYVDDGQPPACE